MNAFDVSPLISGGFILLCIATALGRVFLFGGKDPRRASILVGAVSLPIVAIVTTIVIGVLGSGAAPLLAVLASIVASLVIMPILGCLLGYTAGGLVAGVLLLMDLTESKVARWRKVREPEDDPWPEAKTRPNIENSRESVREPGGD